MTARVELLIEHGPNLPPPTPQTSEAHATGSCENFERRAEGDPYESSTVDTRRVMISSTTSIWTNCDKEGLIE